jgi:CRISPR-associated exonuclease Cas4
MHITGTLIKNYLHCKRQAYLYYNGLNFESETTKIGDILHKEKQTKEYIFEKIKVDDIKDNVLIEYKKTSANLRGTFYQVLYYLYKLKEKGLNLKGLIKDITYNQDHEVLLTSENINKLDILLDEIKIKLESEMPKRLKLRKNCKGCSFKDYCWVE